MKKVLLTLLVLPVLFNTKTTLAESNIGHINVELVTDLSVKNESGGELDFGTMSSQENTVTIAATAEGTRTASNSSALIPENNGQAGSWLIIAPLGGRVNITVQKEVTLTNVSNNNGISEMTATLIPSENNVTVDASTGIYRFYVGGTLKVNANQASGNYVGTYEVSVNN